MPIKQDIKLVAGFVRRPRSQTQGRRPKHRYKKKKLMRKGLKRTDMAKPKRAKTHDHHPLPLPHRR